jgi:F0F1-type ATP synthase membrane subunit b/b'
MPKKEPSKGAYIMLTKIHAEYTVSITDLKKNPQALIDNAHDEAHAITGNKRAAQNASEPKA